MSEVGLSWATMSFFVTSHRRGAFFLNVQKISWQSDKRVNIVTGFRLFFSVISQCCTPKSRYVNISTVKNGNEQEADAINDLIVC
jgi:hypothetical protein